MRSTKERDYLHGLFVGMGYIRQDADAADLNYLIGRAIAQVQRKDSNLQKQVQSQQLEAKKLVRSIIKAEVDVNIKGLPSIDNQNGKNVEGRYLSANRRMYQYKLSESNIRTKEISRQDSKQDDCEKGNPCKNQCIPRTSECQNQLSPASKTKAERVVNLLDQAAFLAESNSKTDRKLASLIYKTIETEQIPTNKEIAELVGTATAEFIRNPREAIKRGKPREEIVREAVAIVTDVDLTRKEAIKRGAKKAGEKTREFIEKNNELLEEAAVNTVGFVGSQVGGVALPGAGAIAGDIVAAKAARKGFRDYRAYRKARAKLKEDEAYQKASKLEKLKMTRDQTLSELKSEEMRKKAEDDNLGDNVGWAVGNAAAEGLARVPGTSGIPLKGAVVAMEVVPEVAKAKERIKNGEPRGLVVKETAKAIVLKPAKRVKQVTGVVANAQTNLQESERRFRQRASRKIGETKRQALAEAQKRLQSR